jgi:vesicle transport protein SEC22
LQRLQETLSEVSSIMRRNIDSVMERGSKLEDIRNQSQKLHDDSKSLAWGAKKLNYQAMLRRYGPFALAGLAGMFFLWVRFYLMI